MTEFEIRHYDPDKDLVLLSKMLAEIESVDRDGEDTSEEYLLSMKEWPTFDPDQNVWIAELDGKFAGYGQALPRLDSPSTIYVVVHPSHRRKGLGSKLLALALSQVRQAQSKNILVYANGKNAASTAFLQRNGFEVAGTSGVMVARVSELSQAEFPAGYTVRRYTELGNPRLVVQALNDCYKDMVGHHQNVTNAERFINYYGEEGIHLLFNEDESLIGICAAKPEGKTDERGTPDLLDAPGLVKEYRHYGMQRSLTLAVMTWLRTTGTRPITLEYWGDDEHAIEIYRSVGFELVNQQITYQKTL